MANLNQKGNHHISEDNEKNTMRVKLHFNKEKWLSIFTVKIQNDKVLSDIFTPALDMKNLYK